MRARSHSDRIRQQLGFTMLEMVTVLAIISIVAAIGAFSLSRSNQRIDLQRASSDLRRHIERVRSLSRSVGSRLGSAQLSSVNCPSPVAEYERLWISLGESTDAPPEVTFPTHVSYDESSDTITVRCQRWNFGGENGVGLQVRVRTARNGGPFLFAFSSTGGWLNAPGVQDEDLMIEVSAGGSETESFRILPGGAICNASVASPTSTRELCDA